MNQNRKLVIMMAGGQILALLEIANGLGIRIREELSNNGMCRKAFDRVVELRHFNCNDLEEINRRLPPK